MTYRNKVRLALPQIIQIDASEYLEPYIGCEETFGADDIL